MPPRFCNKQKMPFFVSRTVPWNLETSTFRLRLTKIFNRLGNVEIFLKHKINIFDNSRKYNASNKVKHGEYNVTNDLYILKQLARYIHTQGLTTIFTVYFYQFYF